jgi:uncharacterized protein (TIGR03084 family)
MREITSALREQQRELAGLLAGIDEDGWGRASPCEGWTVGDVVLHLAQTNELALASAEGRFAAGLGDLSGGPAGDVDEGAALMVERDRRAPMTEILDRWQRGADDLQAALEASDAHTRVEWVAGPLSARTLATTRLAETWIHTGDVAEGLGVTVEPGERLRHVARLAWRTLPYAFARAGRELSGPVAFDLVGPTGEPWRFEPDGEGGATTTIRGDGVELCRVAGRRLDPADTGLTGDGPDVAAVLDLVRTYA